MSGQQWTPPGILEAAVANAAQSRGQLEARLRAIQDIHPRPFPSTISSVVERSAILEVYNQEATAKLIEAIQTEGPGSSMVSQCVAKLRRIQGIYEDILDTILADTPDSDKEAAGQPAQGSGEPGEGIQTAGDIDPAPAGQPEPDIPPADAMHPGQPAEGPASLLILCQSWQWG